MKSPWSYLIFFTLVLAALAWNERLKQRSKPTPETMMTLTNTPSTPKPTLPRTTYYVTVPNENGPELVFKTRPVPITGNRLDAITAIGATVWTEEEWAEVMKLPDLPKRHVIDLTVRQGGAQ